MRVIVRTRALPLLVVAFPQLLSAPIVFVAAVVLGGQVFNGLIERYIRREATRRIAERESLMQELDEVALENNLSRLPGETHTPSSRTRVREGACASTNLFRGS